MFTHRQLGGRVGYWVLWLVGNCCETRTIGPLGLTVPVRRRLGFREMGNRHCPIAEPAELDHGLVAARVTQSRLSDPTAL